MDGFPNSDNYVGSSLLQWWFDDDVITSDGAVMSIVISDVNCDQWLSLFCLGIITDEKRNLDIFLWDRERE